MSRSGHAPERHRPSPLPDEQRPSRPRPDERANTQGSASLWASTLQVRRFATVGLVNTIVDYGIFITLTKLLRLPLGWVWIAKLVSGTVAITVSFYLNRRWVFRSVGGGNAQAMRFLAVTLVGVIGIQTSLTPRPSR